MKIIAVGKNYRDHAIEFDGSDEKPAVPLIFMKPDSAIIKNGKHFYVPDFLGRIDYEAEIVVRINKLGKSIPARFAHRYYDAITVGIDFTARDWQRRLIAAGEPWDMSKVYDRIGLESQTTEILGLNIPSMTIPVKPGRNLAVIIEVAAMNNRQKKMGYNTAEEFNKRLMQQMGIEE